VSLLLAAACISLCSSLHAVEVMKRREIAVSVIGLPRPQLSIEDVSVDKAADYWIKAMDREIGNNPDLIVLPECCDSPAFKNHIDKAKWIRLRGTKVLDAIRRYAAEHGCYIVYSAHREREDGRFANSCFLVNRKGEVRNENYYMPTFTAYINTNCRVRHLDFNRDKFADIIRKYGRRIEIRNPGSVGTVTLLSNDSKLQVDDVVKEFGLETLTDYFTRSRQT